VTDTKVTRSHVTIALFKGVIYSDSDAETWQSLLAWASDIREYVAIIGLELAINEAEGYAYLREQPRTDGDQELPRIIPRRPLSYPQSLLLALLRKRLLELDTRGGDTRLVITRDEMVDMVKLFFSGGTNEAKFVDLIDQHINRIVDLGFLRRMRGRDDAFEVRRILKAFIDAQWLTELEAKLAAYRAHAGAAPVSEDIS
jgi:hypothetical protein